MANIDESFSFQIPKTCEQMMFFTVQKQNVHKIVVPKGAPKVSDRRSLAVNMHPVRQFCAKTRDIKVSLESSNGESLEPHILTTALLSVNDFESLKAWSVDPELYMDFGFAVKHDLASTLQTVASKLIEVSASLSNCRKFVLFDSEDPEAKAMTCLKMLESRCYVQRLSVTCCLGGRSQSVFNFWRSRELKPKFHWGRPDI